MNIGIVTTWFERGAAYVSKAYADILDRRHNVFIYARGGEKYAKEDDKWNAPNVTWGHRYKTLGTRIRWIHFKKWLETNKIGEHTSELQSLMLISYAVFCLKKKNLNRL